MEEPKMELQITCRKCGSIFSIKVKYSDLQTFKKGEKKIQNIFPYLSPGERELLISNICETCFDSIFKNMAKEEK